MKVISNHNLNMQRILFISVFSALLALALAVVCFMQLAVHKVPTEQSVVEIERRFVDRSRLSEIQLSELNETLTNLRWNDRVLKQTRFTLWWVSIFGFLAFAVLSFLSAYLVNREVGYGKQSKPGHSNLD